MAEDFNYLLTIHHFFDKTIGCTKVTLLSDKVFTTFPGKIFRDKEHDTNHYKSKNSQWDIQDNHVNQYTDNGNDTVD